MPQPFLLGGGGAACLFVFVVLRLQPELGEQFAEEPRPGDVTAPLGDGVESFREFIRQAMQVMHREPDQRAAFRLLPQFPAISSMSLGAMPDAFVAAS